LRTYKSIVDFFRYFIYKKIPILREATKLKE
jgi:hypothetical protein